MVGSIGVIMQSLGFHEAIQKLGIESRVQTAGKSKAFLSPLVPQKVCNALQNGYHFFYQTEAIPFNF